MKICSRGRGRRLTLLLAAMLFGLAGHPQRTFADTAVQAPQAAPATPSTSSPAASSPAASPQPASPVPSSPVAPPTTPATPAPPPDQAPGDAEKNAPGITGDATMQTLEVPARPVALSRGKANWDNGFKSITASIDAVQAAVAKAGLKPGGKPIAVFLSTDENGFSYEAMVPLAEKPEGKDRISSDVAIGMSPSGKAIKFEHRGAYDDIDSTYDLITAYLDEKGLEAQNLFIEEYLSDTKKSDDPGLEVDIYVFIK